MKTVGIIGGAGFIGSYITKIFLEENYKVKVSSININHKWKYEHLFQLDNAANLKVESMNARNIAELENFARDCDIIVHAGTPFILDAADPQTEIMEPTILGTRNLLNISERNKTISKVIFLSSVAAFNTSFPLTPSFYPPGHVFTEMDIPFMNGEDNPYAIAKFMANAEVEMFVNNHKDLRCEIVSVSPVLVIGNSLSSRNDSTSVGFQYLVKNKIAPNPFIQILFNMDLSFAMVDVRDVAEAIYRAAHTQTIHGRNYLIASETYSISDMSLMLNKLEPKNEPVIVYDSSRAKNDLGVAFISVKDSLNHSVLDSIENEISAN